MRYLKVPGITVRIPRQSIESADFIMTNWKDKEAAFTSTEGRLRSKLERVTDWKEVEVKGRIINYIKIKIVDFWLPEV